MRRSKRALWDRWYLNWTLNLIGGGRWRLNRNSTEKRKGMETADIRGLGKVA